MEIKELIEKCNECKFATCEQCEYNWKDVQDIKKDLEENYKEKEKEDLVYICCSEEAKPWDLYKYCSFIIFKQIGIPVCSIINSVGGNNIEIDLEKGAYENTDDRLLSRCNKVFVFDEEKTNRMKEIIDLANRLKIPVVYKKDFGFIDSLKIK